MASQRTNTIRNGQSIRRDGSSRSATYIRTDARIERQVSIAGDDNAEIDTWLVGVSRGNPTLKTARNIGGLSLTLLESRALTPALMKKYANYGRFLGMTLMHQNDLSERFRAFSAKQKWETDRVHLDNRLIFLGPKKGPQLGAVCFGVTDKSVLEQYDRTMDYLVYEEGLDLKPRKDFIPHITIDTARHKDMQVLKLPQIPIFGILDAPTLSAFASTARR